MQLGWYLRRLAHMSPGEVVSRARDSAIKLRWRRLQLRRGEIDPLDLSRVTPRAPMPLREPLAVGAQGQAALIAAADAVLDGRWPVFAVDRTDFSEPDWFLDPTSGIRAPETIFAFRYPHRDPARVGNLKYIWEPSRHHHLTVLSAAYALTRDTRYADRVARDLRDWWQANPFLSGPHWISGIELGVRLISWVWCRRLLESWSGAADLFEHNPVFQAQLYRHQQYLHALHSRYSSANNHVIAEAAGQLVASCAFPLFPQSEKWRATAAELLSRELERQTFPCGLNRELATEYHGFVLELSLAAAVECEAVGRPLPSASWLVLRNMMDALATMMDCRGHPPRQGDADDGCGLLLDDPNYDHWAALIHTGARMFGAEAWWPTLPRTDIRTDLLAALAQPPVLAGKRGDKRDGLATEAGMVLLRAGAGANEIWCRCDSGPHGFLSTAGHAHADALSIEFRVGGVEILADNGTFCYHTDQAWRRFFRSTFGHNTLELLGKDQSLQGGPFLWTRQAKSRTISFSGLHEGETAAWSGEHDGYAPLLHRREVRLERSMRTITMMDTVLGGDAPGRLSFHLGPSVQCELRDGMAHLAWDNAGHSAGAELHLPPELEWTLRTGETDPIAGWYSKGFGRKTPSGQLIGTGPVKDATTLTTTFRHIPLD